MCIYMNEFYRDYDSLSVLYIKTHINQFLQNENHKTDGGLGAGTPMFISEVMHGNTCVIL